MRRLAGLCLIPLLSSAGCATGPDVTIYYFLPKAETNIQVTQSLGCTKDGKQIISTATVVPATLYSSDTTASYPFRYSSLDKWYGDSDVSVSLTDDGRLASVNATTTGDGSAIVKSVVGLASAVAVLSGTSPGDADVKAACAQIDAGHTGKPVTLKYQGNISYDKAVDGSELKVDSDSAGLYQKIRAIFSDFSFKVSTQIGTGYVAKLETPGPDPDDYVPVLLRPVANANVSVTGPNADLRGSQSIWTAVIPVPVNAASYQLPIPRTKLFGKQSFSLTLSAYGAVTKLGYVKNSGIADLSDSATAIFKAAQPPGTADEAAAVKAQADLIAQQQRLISCKTDPATCK